MVTSSPVVRNMSMDAEGTVRDAMRQANKAAAEELRNSIRCEGSCIGLPQIIPGRSLKLTKLDKEIDGTYRVVSVEQNIGTDGFVTQFELGGKC